MTQVENGVGAGNGLLLNRARWGGLTRLAFIDNSSVRYFNQAWLMKARDIVEGRRGNVN
jgi:hypothetical protein